MKTSDTIIIFLCSLILLSTITSAQMTFTAADLSAAYAVGNVITNYSDTTIKSVDIGSPGGGNNWNFLGLKSIEHLSTTSELPSSTPYNASDFPNSNIVLSTKRITPLINSNLWQYTTLQPAGYLTNGSVGLTKNNAGDSALTKEVYNPNLTQLSFPFTFNSQWGSNYSLEISTYVNGAWSFINSTYHVNTIKVDAYGSITMPGGGILQALRLKRVSINYHPDGSYNTTSSYLILTTGGFSVTIAVSDTNSPDNGVIQTNSLSWNRIDAVQIFIPAANEVVLAGKTYNSISWDAPGITDPLRIDFSTDGGSTFKTIAGNVAASPGNYEWNVPDILCTKCIIKIVDINDTTKYGTSGLFRIKGWVLTRIDTKGNYEKFEQGKHGWRFLNTNSMWPNFWWSQFNYQTGIDPNTNNPYPRFFHWSPPSSFPDWPLWVKVFTPAQCYVGTGGVYKGKAEWKWQLISNTPFNGSCFGFAASSFMAFSFQSQFSAAYPGIPAFTNLYDLLMNDAIRSTINGDFLLQYGIQSLINDINSIKKDPRTTLQELKDMFMSDNPDIKTISIYNNNGNGGGAHTMAPVKLVQSIPGVYLLYLYNSNHPGDTTGFIKIDSTHNTWADNTGLGSTWNGNTHFYLEIPVSNYFNIPIFPKIISGINQKSTSTGNIEFYNTPDANVIYTASNGSRIGVTDSVVINEIGNGIPIFNKSGYPSNPTGFYIPDDSYSMVLNNAHDATGKVYLTAFKNDVIYSYERDSSNSTQTDRFKIDNGFSVISPDQTNKLVNLGVIAETDTLERIMFVNNTQVAKNDSLYLQQVNQSNFVIKNYGSDKTYDLELNNRSALGQTVFQYPSVILKANSTHTLVPDWGNLNLSKLRILIDTGNKGTNNDSVILVNQYTGINDNNKQKEIPNSYSLAQNYPNPFNPTTTINYQVQFSGQVTLKVYDILGREVAALVNEVKQAGSYSVTFDAGRLASGIYFYKLQSGSFVETKKMILLK